MIWDKEGVEKAETFILEQLKSNPKFDYFFSHWWERRYEEGHQTDRLLPLLNRVKEAYRTRAANLPEKGTFTEQFLEWLEKEIERESPK